MECNLLMNYVDRCIRVLHVDDEPAMAETAAEMLARRQEDLEVEPESDPGDVVDRLSDEEFDCVVSDYEMPEMTGLDLLSDVRESHEDLPFILYTGRGSEEIASEAISAGVTDYLQKETGSEQYELLANRIVNAVEARRSSLESRRRKRRLEMLIENIEGVVYRCSYEPGWPLEFLQGDVEEIFGVPAEHAQSLKGMDAESSIHPEDRERVWQETHEALSNEEEPFDMEYRLVDGKGETIWVRDRTHAVRDGEGEVQEIEGLITDVTDEKRRQRKFEEVFDNTYQFTGLAEPDGTLLEVNEAALDFGGFDREDVVGEIVWETDWFDGDTDSAEVVKEGVETASEGELYRNEMTVEDGDSEIYVDYSARPIQDGSGETSLLVLEGRDITDLKRHEMELQRNQDILRHTEDLADTGGWELDVEADELRWTRGTQRIHGVDDGYEPELEEAIEFYHEDDREEIREAVEDAVAGESFDRTLRITTVDDDLRWVDVYGEPVYDCDEVTGVRGAIQDVTSHVEREMELKEEQAFLESVYQALPDVFYAFDTGLRMLRWNETLSQVTGYGDDEIRQMQPVDFVPADQHEKIAESVRRVLDGEGPLTVESYLETREGERIPYEFTGALVEGGKGGVIGIAGIGRDVSGRLSRRREIQRKNQQLEAVMEAADASIFVKDMEGRYLVLDDTARAVAGVDDVEPGSVTDDDVFPEDVAEQARREDREVVESGEPLQVEKEMPTADGTRTHLVKKTPLEDEDGEVYGVCGVATDVTEVKTYERRIEEFAEIVSHDLQNPLMVAQGNLDLALDEMESEHLERVDEALSRLDELTSDLLELASTLDAGDAEEVEVEDVAEEAWSNVDTGEALRQLDCEGAVVCDRDGLKRLLENLYSNAVRHGAREGDAADLTVHTRLREDGFVVEDDGAGIPDDFRGDVFERGVSGSTGGTGFGLDIVQSICEAHGWSIEVEDSEEGGARFVVTDVETYTGS